MSREGYLYSPCLLLTDLHAYLRLILIRVFFTKLKLHYKHILVKLHIGLLEKNKAITECMVSLRYL